MTKKIWKINRTHSSGKIQKTETKNSTKIIKKRNCEERILWKVRKNITQNILWRGKIRVGFYVCLTKSPERKEQERTSRANIWVSLQMLTENFLGHIKESRLKKPKHWLYKKKSTPLHIRMKLQKNQREKPYFFLFFWDRVSFQLDWNLLCTYADQSCTLDPSASSSQELGLQAYTTIPNDRENLKKG